MRASSSNRGAILIVVLGVLAVLALLGTTFATLQATERNVARNFQDTVRAKMLAMSGVQDAVARLKSLSHGFNDPAMIYWGNNLTEKGAPDWATPLDRAQNVSYAWEDEPVQDPTDSNVKPLIVDIDGVRVGFSGVMGNWTYAPHGDLYRLRVSDCNSLIHVNDGLEGGKDGSTSKNLRRILNNLGELLNIKEAGDRIVDKRPPSGYFAKRELESVLGVDTARILPFVTTQAWVDSSVANPVPISRETLASYPIKYNEKLGLFRYGRSFGTGGTPLNTWPLKFAPEHADPRGVDHAVIALDELNAQYIELTRRAPINVNLAPKEILTSIIAGLQGVFLVERRKSNPHPMNVYSFMSHPVYDNSPGGQRGDEYGYLYSTVPFVKPKATVSGGVEASRVADEIIACRTRAKSPACPGIDYGVVWYGGPFRSWRQFDAFCDGLAAGGLLRDERDIFFDFQTSKGGGGSMTGSDSLVPSKIQPRFAAQALADVLKANFNPNLTLNEINPDANLFRTVDKTDLITCSTEFCFTPMGVFEIECDGMIVTTTGGYDLLSVKQGQMVAHQRISSIVKVYDIYRETTQADFYDGKSNDANGGAPTDSGRSMALGPEPDVGKVASECRTSGWLQLATVGGPNGHAGPHLNSAAHGHFSQNHDLHHHAGGNPKVLRTVGGPFHNNRDRTESMPGPYDPDFGGAGLHRLARDWRAEDPLKGADYHAPGDLRIDGAYVERDSALLYQNSAAVFGLVGTISYWIKPSFMPEMTGKPRTFFCVDQAFRQRKPSTMVQLMHGQWFFASHDNDACTASSNETAPLTYSNGPWVPLSMVAGYSTHEEYGGAVGRVSPSLNHRGHADTDREDLLRHHGWIHVTYMWDMVKQDVTLMINGQVQPQTRSIKVHPQPYNAVDDFLQAPLRIGEPSTTMTLSGRESRNWSADSTIDEVYLWKGDHRAEAQELWSRGRYYVPRTGREATFTSRDLKLAPANARGLAAPSGIGTSAPTPLQVQVLGASWTWYPEKDGKNGEPVLVDYRTNDPLNARVTMSMMVNNQQVGELLTNEGGAAIRDLWVNPGDTLNYKLRVHVPDAEIDTILLTTPVIDDVTIYYSTGTRFLYYELYGGGL